MLQSACSSCWYCQTPTGDALLAPGFRVESENILSRLKLSLCAIIGVVITMAAAFVVFPIRASARLRRATARMLERTGGLAFHLLGEFCEVRVIGTPQRPERGPGSSDSPVAPGGLLTLHADEKSYVGSMRAQQANAHRRVAHNASHSLRELLPD